MTMRFIRYEYQTRIRLGYLCGQTVIDLGQLGIHVRDAGFENMPFPDEALLREMKAVNEPSYIKLALSEVTILAPLDKPARIIGAANNYYGAGPALRSREIAAPILFAKYVNTVLRPNGEILLPSISREVTYEGELAIVIGRAACRVSEDDALSHLAGVTIANDISASDVIRNDGNFFRGKNFDSFLPLGPCLVTLDEIDDLNNLAITTTVDGVIRQQSSTQKMVFKPAELISCISHVFTLEPGDIILTGTPVGVAISHDPPAWLRGGQTVSVEIENVGILTNRVGMEKSNE